MTALLKMLALVSLVAAGSLAPAANAAKPKSSGQVAARAWYVDLLLDAPATIQQMRNTAAGRMVQRCSYLTTLEMAQRKEHGYDVYRFKCTMWGIPVASEPVVYFYVRDGLLRRVRENQGTFIGGKDCDSTFRAQARYSPQQVKNLLAASKWEFLRQEDKTTTDGWGKTVVWSYMRFRSGSTMMVVSPIGREFYKGSYGGGATCSVPIFNWSYYTKPYSQRDVVHGGEMANF